MNDPLDLFQASAPSATSASDNLDLFKPKAAQEDPMDLLQSRDSSKGFLDKAGDIASSTLEAIGTPAQAIINDPRGSLSKTEDFLSNVAESTPRVLGGAAQRAVTGLAQVPLDIRSGADYLGSKAAGALGLDSVQGMYDKDLASSQATNALLAKGITLASPDEINNLTPKEKLAADVTALAAGGVGGTESAMVRNGSKLKKFATAIFGGAAGESATSGSTVDIDPLLLGDKSTDRVVKNRLLNPLEGIGVAFGVSAIPEAVRLARTAADATVTSIANALGKKPIQEIIASVSPEVTDNVSRDALTNYYMADGMDNVSAVQQAVEDMSKAHNGDSAIDPTLSKAGSLYSQVYDRLAMFRNIESDLKGITPKYRDDTPLTADLQIETQRQYKIPEISATQGIAKKTEDGGLDLMTRADVGLPELPVEGSISGTSQDPNLIPGLKQVFQRVQDAGGSAEDAAKYMQYKRIREDYNMFVGDTASRESAIAEAKGNIRDVQTKLRGTTTEGYDFNMGNKAAVPSDGINITAKKGAPLGSDVGYDINLGQTPKVSDGYNIAATDKAVTPATLDEARKALIDAKAMEIRRSGIGLPIDEVDAFISQAETKPWAKVAQDEFGLFFRGARQYLLNEGTIDAVQHDALENFYKDFFPAFRQETVIDNSSKPIFSSTSKGTGLKAATGGETPYKDPLESLLTYTSMFSAAGQRNATLSKAMDILEQLPDEGWNKLFNTSRADYQAQLLGTRSTKAEEVTAQQSNEAANLIGTGSDLTGITGVEAKEGVLSFYKDGKKVVLEVNNKDLMQTLESLSPGQNGTLVKALDSLKNIQRDAIVLNPAFSVANMLMDTSIAGITSRTGAKPFLVTAQGISRMSKDPELYAQYLRDTGGGTSWVNFGEARTQQEVDSLVSALKGEYKNGGMWRTYVSAAKKTLEEGMNKAENSARFEEYARSLEQGADRTAAATRAGELSVNFQQKGSSAALNQWNKVGLFLNATLQSQERVFRLSKTPGAVAKAAAYTITLPALSLYAYNTQFPGYYDIPERIRHSNWIIMYGDKPEDHIQVPMDRIMAPVFAGIPYGILDDIANQTGGSSTVNQVITSMRNLYPLPQFAPPIAQTIWNLNTNQDWQNRPIVRADQTKQPPIEQYNNNTKPTYRMIAGGTKNIGILPDVFKSPVQMDYAASQMLGFMEDIFTSFVTDPIAKKVLGLPEQASRDIGELPVVNRFFGNQAKEYTSDVYNMANNLKDDLSKLSFYNSALNSKTNTDEAQLSRAQNFVENNPEKMEFLEYLEGTMKDMGEFNDHIRNTQLDPDMTPKDKQAEIKQAIADRDEVAKSFVEDVKSNEAYRPYLAYTQQGVGGVQPLITKGLLKLTAPADTTTDTSSGKLIDSVRHLLNRKRE